MDVHDQKTRSYNMSCIKGINTKPEEIVRKCLFAHGFRYRKNDKRLPGKPDIVLPKYKTVIFINGCFWHKHEGCKYFSWPKNHADFWRDKLEGNVERDKKKTAELKNLGWKVCVVWECAIKKAQKKDETMAELAEAIIEFLNSDKMYQEL